MKNKILVTLFCAIFSFAANAQGKESIKKETVKVYGNCEMCQSKIEKAAKDAGATVATWDVDKKILSVSYNPSKSSIQKIEKAVAASGYDTEHEVATTDAYNNLPGCCQYDRKGSGSDKKD